MSTAEAVTIGFLTFGFARLWHTFNMRSAESPLLRNEITRNVYVWIAILVGVVLLLAATYIAPLAQALGVVVPGTQGWLLCLSFSLLPLIVGQALKSFPVRRPHPGQTRHPAVT